MNKQVIRHLADVIERDDYEFDMNSCDKATKKTSNHCGTPGCIAGIASAIWPSVNKYGWTAGSVGMKLGIYGDWVNLTDKLFFPEGLKFDDCKAKIQYKKLTRKGAVATLRRLADTGEVKWFRSEQV